MRHITLEIPLRPLALARRGQRDDAADARIEPLGDPLDRPALARRIAPFEQHRDLQPLLHHPFLQDHEFVLQPEQLAEIDTPVERFAVGMIGHVGEDRLEPAFVHLHLQLLVEAVGDFFLDAVEVGEIIVHMATPALPPGYDGKIAAM